MEKKFTMKATLAAIVITLMLNFYSSSIQAQCAYVENFSGVTTVGASTFTSNGQTFTVTTNSIPSGYSNFGFDNYQDGGQNQGWSNAGSTLWYLDNVWTGGGTATTGTSFTISSASPFYLKSFWIFCTNDANAYTFPTGASTITVQGQNSGGTALYTSTGTPAGTLAYPGWNPGGSDSTHTLADPYLGWTFVDMRYLNGTDYSNTQIYKFKITTPANARMNYVAFDGFAWSTVVTNAPSVTSSAATSVTSTTATLNGSVNNNNASTTSFDSFQYSSTSSTLSSGITTVVATTGATATGTSSTTIAKSLSGLAASTTYYFRAISTNCNGTTLGSILSFTTPSANTTPTFVTSSPTLVICNNAGATDIKGLLHVSDVDLSQTETWSQSVAPNHGGTLTITSASAASGSANITPGGTINYTPSSGYSGPETFTIQVSDGTASSTVVVSVTVNPAPNNITGVFTFPVNAASTLSSTTSSGTWSSVSSTVASISAGGVATGLTAGTSLISYTKTGCAATQTITVSALAGQNWYSKTTGGDASVLTNWWSNNNNTGYQPTLYSATGDTWIFQSAMTSTGALTFGGNISIVSGGTFTPLASSNTNVGGNFTQASGGSFVPNSGTVTMNGTSGTITASSMTTAGTNCFNHLSFNASSATTYTIASNLLLTGNFTNVNSNATIALGGNTITVGGNWANPGPFTTGASSVIMNGGTVTMTGSR